MSNSKEELAAEHSEGAPDELEPGKVVEAELGRLIRHPRAETARLKQIEEAGEQGSAPFILIARVALWVVPFVAIFVGAMLLIYFKA
jgi:hypothetical protein